MSVCETAAFASFIIEDETDCDETVVFTNALNSLNSLNNRVPGLKWRLNILKAVDDFLLFPSTRDVEIVRTKNSYRSAVLRFLLCDLDIIGLISVVN
jgi:hypothetical protein